MNIGLNSPVAALSLIFVVGALIELWRERVPRLYFSRVFALAITLIAGVLLITEWGELQVVTHRDSLLDQLQRMEGVKLGYISHIPFSGAGLFSMMSVGVFLAGVLFCPSAPIMPVKASRIFSMQALLIALIYVERVEWFLTISIAIILGLILLNRDYDKGIVGDEQRVMRVRAFTFYHGVALGAMVLSLLLRLAEMYQLLPFSNFLWLTDLSALCVAAAIVVGLFPFHGWALPFFGTPRVVIFLQMFCIQTGLLFFLRFYVPIISTYGHHSILFVAIPVVGIVYSAMLFFGEFRLKRIPGNLYLSHVCLMAIAVVGMTSTSATPVILDSVNVIIATLGLMGVCCLLTSRFGIRGVLVPTGLGSFFPEIGICYLICVLSLVGFPGTLGFIEEEVLLGQGIGHHNFLVAVVAIAFTLNGFSSFRLFARVFLGQPELGQDTETGLNFRERVIIYAVIAMLIVNGLAPSFIVDTLHQLEH